MFLRSASESVASVKHYCFGRATDEISITNSNQDIDWVLIHSNTNISNLISSRIVSEIDSNMYLGSNFSVMSKGLRKKVAKTIHDEIGYKVYYRFNYAK